MIRGWDDPEKLKQAIVEARRNVRSQAKKVNDEVDGCEVLWSWAERANGLLDEADQAHAEKRYDDCRKKILEAANSFLDASCKVRYPTIRRAKPQVIVACRKRSPTNSPNAQSKSAEPNSGAQSKSAGSISALPKPS